MSKSDADTIDLFAKKNFEINLAQSSMPVQDAIDLAEFLVDTTKGFFRFKLGADTVGGDTDIAVVTRHEGFKWIKRKHYYPHHLNPLETDHVDIGHQDRERGTAIGSTRRSPYARIRISSAYLRKPQRQFYRRPKRRKE